MSDDDGAFSLPGDSRSAIVGDRHEISRSVTATQLREILANRSVELQLRIEQFTEDIQLSMPVDGGGVRLRVSVAPGEESKIPQALEFPLNGDAVCIPLEARPDLETYRAYCLNGDG